MQEKEQNFAIIKSRIMQIPDILGITKAEFYKKIEVSPSNYNGKSRFSEITADVLHKISMTYSEISIDWLVTGNGPMLKNIQKTDEQDSILPAYQCLNENTNQGIPLIPSSAMAGFFTGDIQVLEYECERFIIPSFKDADFLISVKGSSMEPKYSSGDLVACKRMSIDTFFQWNKVYVLDTEQGPLIKRVNEGKNENTLLICSENPKYPPFQLNRSLIHNIALVVGVIRLE